MIKIPLIVIIIGLLLFIGLIFCEPAKSFFDDYASIVSLCSNLIMILFALYAFYGWKIKYREVKEHELKYKMIVQVKNMFGIIQNSRTRLIDTIEYRNEKDSERQIDINKDMRDFHLMQLDKLKSLWFDEFYKVKDLATNIQTLIEDDQFLESEIDAIRNEILSLYIHGGIYIEHCYDSCLHEKTQKIYDEAEKNYLKLHDDTDSFSKNMSEHIKKLIGKCNNK